MSDQNGSIGDKTMRVIKDCIVDPVYKKEGFWDNTCREYSPERPENLEPKDMHEFGSYAYSKLSLPSSKIKMSGASDGAQYASNAPMTIGTSGTGTSGTSQGSSSNADVGQGAARVNYGTFDKPDYKGKGTTK